MADLNGANGLSFAPATMSPFSELARQQYAALARMRLRVLTNSFRSVSGAFEFGAHAISFLIYSMMGIGLGAGAGAAAYALVAGHHLHSLAIEFWVLFLLWQAISIVLASFVEQFDLGTLLRFPVNFGSFFLLHLVFGLADVSTIAGGLACLGILVGVGIASPELAGATVLSLLAFGAFNVFLVRAIFAWLDRWLAKRRSREIVSAVFVLAMMSLQLLNPALRNEERGDGGHGGSHNALHDNAEFERETWFKRAALLQAWLPPGLASGAIEVAARQDGAMQAGSIGLLSAYALGAAALLGVRLRAEYRGENLGEAPGRAEKTKADRGWLLTVGGPIATEIEKELRVLFRSMTQLYAISVPPAMVIVIGSLFRQGASVTRRSPNMALPICVAYGLLGFTQLIYNNLGAEGRGIQMVFLFPLRVRTVLLAKNLFHGSLYCLIAVASGVVASFRLGRPDGISISITLAWLAFALPANLAAGNVLSLTMPYRVNLGRIGRQAGSQANALFAMAIQTLILGVGAGAISLCGVFGELWMATPVLLGLAIFSAVGWLLVLRNADAMANRRRDTLLAKLVKAD